MESKINNLNLLSELIHTLFLNSKDLHCKTSLKEMSNNDIESSISIWKKYWFESFDKMSLNEIELTDNVIVDLNCYDIFINQIINNINKFNYVLINQDFNLGIYDQVFKNQGLIKFKNTTTKFTLKDYCIGDALNCDSFECENNSILCVRKCKSIKGWQNARIEAHDVDFIEVFGKCIVDAYNVKKIIAHDYCIIRADENCDIEAESDCIISTDCLNRVTIIKSLNTYSVMVNE